MTPQLSKLVLHCRGALPRATILTFDPGETTGMAVFKGIELRSYGQLGTGDVAEGAGKLREQIQKYNPDIVVTENYKIYGWKADDHKWAELHTAQMIGAIKVLCDTLSIPMYLQMAIQAKSFVTDEKLHDWGYYARGMKHSRDAIRHGISFILFNKEVPKELLFQTKHDNGASQ
jgi:hypothetical protein